MKQALTYLAIAFVIFFIVTNPGGAADLIHSGIHGLNKLASGFGDFVSSL